ncbi:acetyltransferase (GNAT) family protein [Streptomyces sp. 1114.5]|uniref:GNAT family N-acetyltransferase n=1 Tax=Streptomyces sp. 1114.5 TaxID=1938830 RepID=UPI000EB0AD11|nr:GNAT family N-acetyltransferase [Streptomyces sp. 1114.5]RKT19736.1 acetyltransferase (GNAT) family protein [Streptomyces sp. 1114.5]
MTNNAPRRPDLWTVTPADVTTPEALELLREYYYDVANRYYRLHLGREGSPEQLEAGLADSPSDHLAAPDGQFLIGRHDGTAHACAGLRRLDATTVELTRVYVRPELRGTGGGARLLAAVDEAARTLGAERIVLDTRLDLVEARALYLRNGYREIPAYNGGPYAEIWYGKELTTLVQPVS